MEGNTDLSLEVAKRSWSGGWDGAGEWWVLEEKKALEQRTRCGKKAGCLYKRNFGKVRSGVEGWKWGKMICKR